MAQFNNKSEVVVDEINKTATIFDASGYELACRYFNDCNSTLADITNLLKEHEVEVSEEFLKTLLLKGKGTYLCTYAVQQFEKWAKSHDYPSYLIEDGKKKAEESVDGELIEVITEKIIDFFRDLKNAGRAAMPEDEQFTYYPKTKTLQLNNSFLESTKSLYTMTAASDEIDMAKRLVLILTELREIDSKGYDMVQFVQSYMGSRYHPDKAPSIDFDSLLLSCLKYPFRVAPFNSDQSEKERTQLTIDYQPHYVARNYFDKQKTTD